MYYQDTDSFFIEEEDLYKKLVPAFENMYNRELIGSEMGQFHSDFCSRDGNDNVECATECLFIRKKLYCCKLLMAPKGRPAESVEDDSYNISFRCKGVPVNSFEEAAKIYFPSNTIEESILNAYKHLYKGGSIPVDLCDGGPCFRYSKNCTVFSEETAVRTVTKTADTSESILIKSGLNCCKSYMEDGSIRTIFRCEGSKEEFKLAAMNMFPHEVVDEAVFKAYKCLDNGNSINVELPNGSSYMYSKNSDE
jgi:hypothetical protein